MVYAKNKKINPKNQIAMTAQNQDNDLIIPSKLSYAVNLFSVAKSKSNIELTFNDFFDSRIKKACSVEDSAYKATIYTYFKKMGEVPKECAMIFCTTPEIVSEIIDSHQERYCGKQSIYYRMFLRLLNEVNIPNKPFREVRKIMKKGLSSKESYETTADKIFEAITQKTHYSIEDIMSLSRKENLQICRVAFVDVFISIHPNATQKAIGHLLGDRDHSTIINCIKTHKSNMSNLRDHDPKAQAYRELRSHIYQSVYKISA